ncbi:hypothetical protein BDFG_04188 [Blastomyces dermatitidis ATCC 26199]|nr:hypothetical protein BDFG_04188 [Blastomyces dermatitidis ATCC 26199]
MQITENQQTVTLINTTAAEENEKRKRKKKKQTISVKPDQVTELFSLVKKKQTMFIALKNEEKNDEISDSEIMKLKLLQLQVKMHQLCKIEKEMKCLHREQSEAVSLLQMTQLSQQSVFTDITALIKKFKK